MAQERAALKVTYRIPQNFQLRWRLWDDEFVIYCPISGNTHLLDQLTGQILKCLEKSPGSNLELASLFSREFDLEFNAELVKSVEDRLSKLCDLNLIEQSK